MNDTTKSEDKPADDSDWLGYGVYADTLWARIETAIKKDDVGDDPLVIGLFGEWGAGKSHLLKLIQNRAEASLTFDQERRKELDAGFSLTIPVFFQPWKYEHEEFLHVPMLMHILDAYVKAWEKAQTGSESTITELKKWAEKAKPLLGWGWRRVLRPAAESFAGQFSLKLKLAPEIEELAKDLSNFVQVLQDEKDREAVPLKATRDGHYYYRWHETMRQLTRPALYPELLKDEKGKQLDVSSNPKINFVVFIDDLDRCLPEKAVQTLELIKTMFNVESFAFVLALDDEVIERGIGHRYQAYNFAGKKPEMPITGFEYLEKIVHLPFKLPALTQTQAKKFITHVEKKIAPNEPSWFEAREIWSPTGNRQIQMSDDVTMPVHIFDLGELALSAFDAFVPRKLTRLVELWYSTVEIAQKRYGADSQKKLIEVFAKAQLDARIAFAVLMVQLFHPDLYRVFRRHEQTFRTFYDSFVPGGLSESISDIDLWRWAAFTRSDKASGQLGNKSVYQDSSIVEEQATDLKTTLIAIAKLDDGYRYPAQQKRLPLVERLIEHRSAQRHVFDALKLFEALKKQMPKLPEGFKIAQYFSLLSEFDEALTPPPAPPVEVDLTKRFTTDANLLYNCVISADEGMQKAIPTLPGFDSGHSVSAEVLENVFSRVSAWLKEADDAKDKVRRESQLLRGLTYLARYIAPQEREKWWGLVKSVSNETAPDLKQRALWHDAREALSQNTRFSSENLYFPSQTWKDSKAEQEPINGFVYVISKVENFKSFNNLFDGKLKPFLMARYLTTVAQYGEFVKNNPKEVPENWAEQQPFISRPVVNVTWQNAQAYVTWLNGKKVLGNYKAALPNEWQWERAARAKDFANKDDREFPWGGNDPKTAHLHANIRESMIFSSSVVGMFESNPLGIFDLSGNAWEWQKSWFDSEENYRTLRGGSWANPPDYANCSYRRGSRPDSWSSFVGFRLVLSLADSEP